ncbi:MAG: hypothetical protein ABI787_03220 [Spartobacteria bacterium]
MRKSRILIVADDTDLTGQSSFTLRDSGLYEVLVESEPASALNAARDFQPRIILLDLDAPNEHTRSFAEEAASDPFLRHVPVLFFTSLLDGTQSSLGHLPSGGRRLLGKPLNPDRVLQTIATFESAHVA